MEKISAVTNDELEKVRLSFPRCANRDLAPLSNIVCQDAMEMVIHKIALKRTNFVNAERNPLFSR